MILAILGFGIMGFVVGVVYGYGWGYRKGLKKLPDDITTIVKQQAEDIAKKNIQELKDKMEGGNK